MDWKTSLIQITITVGYEKITELLIENGVDVDIECSSGTALYKAVMLGMKSLFKQNNLIQSKTIHSDLGQNKTVNLLVKNGANLNYKDKYGRSALIQAAEFGQS